MLGGMDITKERNRKKTACKNHERKEKEKGLGTERIALKRGQQQ